MVVLAGRFGSRVARMQMEKVRGIMVARQG